MIDSNDTASYKLYQQLKNKLRQYKIEPTIKFLIQELHEIYFLPIDKCKSSKYIPPWGIFLLIKFILNHQSHSLQKKHKTMDKESSISIYEIFEQLRKKQKPEAIYNKNETLENRIKKFKRQTSFQQFWLQPSHGLNFEKIDRALYLFLNNNDFNIFFQEKTGISIECFFKITVYILKYFFEQGQINTFFKIDLNNFKIYLNNIEKFSTNEINKYFNLLSLTIKESV